MRYYTILLPLIVVVISYVCTRIEIQLYINVLQLILNGVPADQRYEIMAKRMSQIAMTQYTAVDTDQCGECSMPRSIHTTDTINRIHNTTLETIYNEYLFKGVPVIVTDGFINDSINTLSLYNISTLLPDAILQPRSKLKQNKLHGVNIFDRAKRYTMQHVVQNTKHY